MNTKLYTGQTIITDSTYTGGGGNWWTPIWCPIYSSRLLFRSFIWGT